MVRLSQTTVVLIVALWDAFISLFDERRLMEKSTREMEDEILREANSQELAMVTDRREQRKHEQTLAKFEAEKTVEIERIRQNNRDERYPLIFYAITTAIVAVGILAIIFVIGYLINSNDVKDNETAQSCVAIPGAQWIDGNCFKNSEDYQTYMKEIYG